MRLNSYQSLVATTSYILLSSESSPFEGTVVSIGSVLSNNLYKCVMDLVMKRDVLPSVAPNPSILFYEYILKVMVVLSEN